MNFADPEAVAITYRFYHCENWRRTIPGECYRRYRDLQTYAKRRAAHVINGGVDSAKSTTAYIIYEWAIPAQAAWKPREWLVDTGTSQHMAGESHARGDDLRRRS